MFYFSGTVVFFFYMVVTSYVLSLGPKQLSWHFGIHLPTITVTFLSCTQSTLENDFVLFHFVFSGGF